MAAKMDHATLVTTSVTGEQVILSVTVAGSPYSIKLMTLGAAYTTYSATEAYMGFGRFQLDWNLGAGWETKDRGPAFVNTDLDNNSPLLVRPLGAGLSLAVGQKIRGICNPATATSIRWNCSIWGNQ
jgi:hypothetical protein